MSGIENVRQLIEDGVLGWHEDDSGKVRRFVKNDGSRNTARSLTQAEQRALTKALAAGEIEPVLTRTRLNHMHTRLCEGGVFRLVD